MLTSMFWVVGSLACVFAQLEMLLPCAKLTFWVGEMPVQVFMAIKCRVRLE